MGKAGIFTKKTRGEAIKGCEYCGRHIKDAFREFASTERDHYCSLQCWRKHYPLPTRACKTCGKEFNFPPDQLKHRAVLYCSQKCYWAAPRRDSTVERICEQCKDTFRMHKGQLKHNAGKFCSRQCYKNSLNTKE